MLVGIDASRAVADRPTGTETYSQRLIRALLQLESDHHYRLYFRDPPPPGLYPKAELRPIPFPRVWTHLRLSWEMVVDPPDLLFVPSHVVPLVHPSTTVVTVHDLGYLHFPSAHPWAQRTYLDLSTRWSTRAASQVLADSYATKADLVHHYGADPGQVTVVYPGVDESLRPVTDDTRIAATSNRYGISGDYLLFLGTLQPRKNLRRLVEAFAKVIEDPAAHQIQLVLAGKKGWLCRGLSDQIAALKLEDRVILSGYVAEEDKAALLSGALGFIFPSLYEGFGLPVLEAQACGCPVVTSNSSSLPEVAGEAALLVDPRDVDAIAAAAGRLISDPELRYDLRTRGFANVERFSWQVCAQTVLRAIEQELCQGTGTVV
jgi:glycosyltransferase involved in cell wall biosynthesis